MTKIKNIFMFAVLTITLYILFFSFVLFKGNLIVIDTKINIFKFSPNNLDNSHGIRRDDKLRGIPNKSNAYLVNTQNCQIIRWPIFDEQTVPLFQNMSGQRLNCNHGRHLFDFIRNKNQKYYIKRQEFYGIKYQKTDPEFNDTDIKCNAYSISRNKTDDDKIIISNTGYHLDKIAINYFPNESLLDVRCYKQGIQKYQRAIPLIPELKGNALPDEDMPNILFIGYDSISRANFERHFPLTIELLSKHKFYTMFGYNKVGDNTFPNLTPLLTGHYVNDIWNESMGNTTYFDYFPFIWKDFKSLGYKTLFMEDFSGIATYNYLRKGFKDSPTDYYLRPFALAIENNIWNNCYNNRLEIEDYYEYLKDFLEAMRIRNQKYFAFTFMTRLTHNELNNAGLADPIVAQLFTDLFAKDMLKNTILVFFSDHGIRYGPIRETLSGKVEERMPFMHLYVPQKWRNSYLKLNENRLTTPFDIHATLRHIIEGKPDLTLKYGKSLLEEIPEDRSCQSIPILEHWCSCQRSQAIHDLTEVEPISKFIVKSVNSLVAKEFGTECVELTLERTVSAFEQHLTNKVLAFDWMHKNDENYFERHPTVQETIRHYLVTVRVSPSNALFEATVHFNENTKNMRIVGDVSRINLYGNQSDCIDSPSLRRYCFCRNHLQG